MPGALATFLLARRCRNVTCEECDRSLPFLALPLVSGGIRECGERRKGDDTSRGKKRKKKQQTD